MRLLRGLLHVSDEVVAVLVLLETTEGCSNVSNLLVMLCTSTYPSWCCSNNAVRSPQTCVSNKHKDHASPRTDGACTYPGMYCIGQRPPTSQCVVTYLLRVLKVLEEGVLIPRHTLVDVGGRVAEALDLTRLAAEDAVQVRADYAGEQSTD